jgi:hypothetical protein
MSIIPRRSTLGIHEKESGEKTGVRRLLRIVDQFLVTAQSPHAVGRRLMIR